MSERHVIWLTWRWTATFGAVSGIGGLVVGRATGQDWLGYLTAFVIMQAMVLLFAWFYRSPRGG